MAEAPEDKNESDDQERAAFEDLVGKLLKVPKGEVDELRKGLEDEHAKDT